MQPILSQDAQSKTQVSYEDAKHWDPPGFINIKPRQITKNYYLMATKC